MNFIFIIYLVLCIEFSFSEADFKQRVQHLENVIKTNIGNALKYQFPKDGKSYFGEPVSNETINLGRYDFIIVGAGSAGSVIANRLSAIKDWNILLIEAGGNENEFSDIPAMMYYTHLSPFNWGYNTTSQTTCCLGMVKQQCTFPRGKVVGGSSTINALMYVRGNKADYDKWAEQGNYGWSYQDVLPYFMKSEKSLIDHKDWNYHGNKGPLDVSNFSPVPELVRNFLRANFGQGNKYVDYNGFSQIGVSKLQMNLKRGKRASTGRAFLDPVIDRLNLNLITNALVTKILINKINRQASGLLFRKDGRLYKVKANREIILSAGAINTPQILILSGIGNKKYLEKLNINTIVNSPVGENLQDHATFFGLNFRTNFTFSQPNISESVSNYLNGTGLLTYAGNTQALGFINTLNRNKTIPDIEYIFIPPPSNSEIAQAQYNTIPEVTDTFLKNINRNTDFRIYVSLLHPKSKGKVTLKSKNPFEFPNIDLNYFSDSNDEDLNTMYRGIQFVIDLVNSTRAFRKIIAKLEMNFHLCDSDEYEKFDKKYWMCAIRYLSSTLYHPTGTTRMGFNVAESVVNDELKVHGIGNLRVADCGVMPSTISGHTNAAAIMIVRDSNSRWF